MTPFPTPRRTFLAASAATLATGSGTKQARAATTLRWATVLAPTHPEAIMMERIAKEVREGTGGSVDIQTFPGGQLGSPRDTVEATSLGAIQLVSDGGAQFGQFVPPLSIIEAPYIWRDAAHMKKALASPIMEPFDAQLIQKRGMRLIGSTYYGRRHVTSGTRAIKSVEDMKGFRLRIPEIDLFRAMVEAWGARPTPLNINELYLALSQGVVDGQENPLPTIQSNRLNEVQKHLVLTGHIITPRLIAVNEAAWKGLAEKDRTAIRSAIATHTAWQDAEIASQEVKLLDTFKSGGMTITEPDLDSFRKPVLAVVPARFEERWGKGTWDRIQSV